MTNVKSFIFGAVLGTLFGAGIFGATLHLLLVGVVVLGLGGAALGGRRWLLSRRRPREASKELNGAREPV